MSIGIIDIGSNTVRLSVFDEKTLKQTGNAVEYAGLISYVFNGRISDDGKSVLCTSVLKMKKICEKFCCNKIKAFATASLRDILDKQALVSEVFDKTGVLIEIISGEREAELDYLGLKSEYDVKSGAVFDLGGGSAQLIRFENGKVTDFTSKKIGALKLYNEFVFDVFPTDEECIKIREFVRNQLSDFKHYPLEFAFAMGGAASSIKKLYKELFNKAPEFFTIDEINGVLDIPENLIRAVIPERIYTIRPAVIAMDEILKALGTNKIKCVTCGVRDGMIFEMCS